MDGKSFATRLLNFLIGGRSEGYKRLQSEFNYFYETTLNDDDHLFFEQLAKRFLCSVPGRQCLSGRTPFIHELVRKGFSNETEIIRAYLILNRFLYCDTLM